MTCILNSRPNFAPITFDIAYIAIIKLKNDEIPTADEQPRAKIDAVTFNTEIEIKIIKHFFRLLFISVKILFFMLLFSFQIFIYRSVLHTE